MRSRFLRYSRAASRACLTFCVMGFIERTIPHGTRWAFELKHYRFMARRDGDHVPVFSRHGKDWSDKVPAIVEAMLALPLRSATLDGEGVVVDKRGLTDFDRVRCALARRGGSRAVFLYAFDVLKLDGDGVRRDPWETRRETLASLLRKARLGIRLSEHLDGAEGAEVFIHACRMGLEGIVAKRRDRPYRSGRCRRLGEDQEPGRAGDDADHGMGVIMPIEDEDLEIREILQSVEDALIDRGHDHYVVATEHGTFHWETVDRARAREAGKL
jgi:hypothetical protein